MWVGGRNFTYDGIGLRRSTKLPPAAELTFTSGGYCRQL